MKGASMSSWANVAAGAVLIVVGGGVSSLSQSTAFFGVLIGVVGFFMAGGLLRVFGKRGFM
jgi:hypothetical protein